MNNSTWSLVQDVEKYVELTDKDLEDINFHGGVICFRLYIEKMIQNQYASTNSVVKVKSITWQEGRDVLYVKYVQTTSYDYGPLREAITSYLSSKGVKNYKLNCAWDGWLKEHAFTIDIRVNQNDVDDLLYNVSKMELKNILKEIEPEAKLGVHIILDIL